MVIQINLNPTIPPLPRVLDKKQVDIRYMLIPPYASAHIFWNDKIKELVYELEEPSLDDNEKKILDKIEKSMLELININVAVDKSTEAVSNYIDKTARLL